MMRLNLNHVSKRGPGDKSYTSSRILYFLLYNFTPGYVYNTTYIYIYIYIEKDPTNAIAFRTHKMYSSYGVEK